MVERAFNPKRLREARMVRELSIAELADIVGVSKQAISQFELGESTPKAENMMAIINALRFPKSFFYGDSEQYVGNTFFRANATATKKIREIQLNKSYLAGYIYDYLSKYIDFPKLNLPDTKDFSNCNWDAVSIEKLAQLTRDHWGLGDKPITNIVNLLERNGIMVFTIHMDSEKIDAFCQHRKGRPFIFLGDDKQSAVRRQLDGAHELGHRLMHEDVNNDLLSKEEFKKIEEQANRFASAFLLPAEAFAKTVTSTSLLHFVELKKYWKVSIAAMIYRCKDLGLITESKFTSLFKQMSMKRMRVKEPLDDVIPVPEPVVLRKSIQLLLEKKVKNELQIIHESGVPQEYVEMFCNLDPGALNVKDPEATVKLAANPLN